MSRRADTARATTKAIRPVLLKQLFDEMQQHIICYNIVNAKPVRQDIQNGCHVEMEQDMSERTRSSPTDVMVPGKARHNLAITSCRPQGQQTLDRSVAHRSRVKHFLRDLKFAGRSTLSLRGPRHRRGADLVIADAILTV